MLVKEGKINYYYYYYYYYLVQETLYTTYQQQHMTQGQFQDQRKVISSLSRTLRAEKKIGKVQKNG